jgi:flagellar biosynthesis anti-sigma factor FlgM
VTASNGFVQGVKQLAWVKASRVADNTAMTNPARMKSVSAEEAHCDVRMEKVERLRAEIANGSYAVSSEVLADKLMEHMCELDNIGESGRKR